MLSFLISVYAVLRTLISILIIKLRFLRIAANYLLIASRIPGDFTINVLEQNGWLSEEKCVAVVKALVYLLSGFISISIIIFLFRWIF